MRKILFINLKGKDPLIDQTSIKKLFKKYTSTFMKKNILTLLSCLTIAIFISSCQKEISLKHSETEKAITKAPIEQQYAYVRENFKIILNDLAPLFKDPLFIDYLRAEAAKKFDGDYNVLIKTIIENPVYRQRINYNKIQGDLNAFKGIGGTDYDPQIYFPFFEQHQLKRKSNAKRTALLEDEEIVIYDGDESTSPVPIYEYDDISDSLMATGAYADADYANENELLVISLNEAGRLANPEEPGGTGVSGGTGGTGVTQSVVNFRIQQLTIKDGKESWLGGASEVHIKSNGTTWSHILAGNTSGPLVSIPNLHYNGQTELKGHLIKKVPRSDINCGFCATYTVNFPMHTNWAVDNYFVDPIVYTYVIFEYDAWPAGSKTLASKIPSAPNPNNQLDAMNFRSSNTPYGGIPGNAYINYAIYGNVSGLPSNYQYLYYDGHHINTENIEFNTVKY